MQGAQAKGAKAGKTPSSTCGFGGKPPVGKTPAHKGQLTSKLEKSSSTPLVEVVAGTDTPVVHTIVVVPVPIFNNPAAKGIGKDALRLTALQ